MGHGHWGSGSWGSGPWGGGGGVGALAAFAVIPIRENVLRVEFSVPVYLTTLLEPADASRPEKWTVTEVVGTSGLNGDVTRPVKVVSVMLSTEDDGVAEADLGRFVNLVLDRPMTPWPARYSVSWIEVFAEDLESVSTSALEAEAVYRRVEPPSLEAPRPSLDFANPQTAAASRAASGTTSVLGTFPVDDSGDYATDSGLFSLKKRCLRRVFTKKNAFAHLLGYGVGLASYAKQLGRPSVVAFLQADCEAQISREPEVVKVRARILPNANRPDLFILRLAIRPKVGKPFTFAANIPSA